MIHCKRPWEGITWVLDLLPEKAMEAIAVLETYYYTHAGLMPDGRTYGLFDAISIIRAKYLEHVHPREYLTNLKPREFEVLIENLYKAMGYSAKLTGKTRDGGKDIIAQKKHPGGVEKILIECKRYDGNIGVKFARELYGIVESEGVTKGVLITTAISFTKPAREFAHKNHRIELIAYSELNRLLNRYLGQNWPVKLNDFTMENRISTSRENMQNC